MEHSISNEQPDVAATGSRTHSFSSHQSEDSHTAAEFINSQLQLEADAREALPYKFDSCTKTLGKLRQSLFSCLTCNPPSKDPSTEHQLAGVCYSCSIQCHGDHILVELFNKRDFVCDCGTTRLPSTAPCTLRINPETNTKGGVHSELPEPNNKYNQNFKNKFCACECDYNPDTQKGTMFQCLGLGTAEEGGCGEDWYHPGCIVGLGPDWFEASGGNVVTAKTPKNQGLLESITEVAETAVGEPNADVQNEPVASTDPALAPDAPEEDKYDGDDDPLPPGFPAEDDFDGFLCYKCVEAHPWIKRYAGAPGFLGPVFKRSTAPSPELGVNAKTEEVAAKAGEVVSKVLEAIPAIVPVVNSKKRKADEDEESIASSASKRPKADNTETTTADETAVIENSAATDLAKLTKPEGVACKASTLPSPTGLVSLFFKPDFRNHLCHCTDCFPLLKPHTQLLEEEETYEPDMTEGSSQHGGSTVGSGSIYDRGESALKNVDRVRAIEGVMAYNHLKDKLKPFFQQFAESGKAISAEDIKAHFAKMRGDDSGVNEEGGNAKDDVRKEQPGY